VQVETQRSYGSVSSPLWHDRAAYVIGGGPSLRGVNLEPLRGRAVIAVNDSALRLPWASVLFSLDREWVRNRSSDIEKFEGEKYLAVDPEELGYINGVTYLQRCRDPGLSEYPSMICMGGNSGYAAFNVAFLKQTKMIFLLGFDFKCGEDQASHWYDKYEWWTSEAARYWPRWAKHFSTALPQLRKHGVSVFNCSMDSRISAFPKIPVDDILNTKEAWYVDILRKSRIKY